MTDKIRVHEEIKEPIAPDRLANSGHSPVLPRQPAQNFQDYIATAPAASGCNFKARGPLVGTNMMKFHFTCDLENVRHMFTRNFANYSKGDEFAEVFTVLGGTIFTADGEPWRRQRARIQHVLTRPELLAFMSRCCRVEVERGLMPLMSRMASTGTPFDMDDVLGRLVFDLSVTLVLGENPACLSAAMPPVPAASAMDAVMEVAFLRHTVPGICSTVMRRLNVGPERRLATAESTLRRFVAERIHRRIAGERTAAGDEDILSHYVDDQDFLDGDGEPTEFTHRTFINFLVAFRDAMGAALSWLIYNLAKNPGVVSGIRRELAAIVSRRSGCAISTDTDTAIFNPEETKRLAYLRAAMFESLRLYPSGPIERKEVVADDVLPSGHRVHAGDVVLVSMYAMGRMESVWGEDCREYRPERWLSAAVCGGDPDGPRRLQYVPSYKFLSFNTGPRSCLGKSIAVAQMTAIAAAVVWNFDLELVEGHAVVPKVSVVLQMKNGLMLKVSKRKD
ncbi:hypothetical protein ACP4OV_016398 [Aristida adscensionis]